MNKIIPFIILLLNTLNLNAQADFMLNHFSLYEVGETIVLDWTIKEGSVCNGISVFRSTDGVNYEKIGDLFGVCGDITKAENYTFVDKNPVGASFNYYKLELGLNGFTNPVSVYFADMEGNTSLFAPNPSNGDGTFYYRENGDVVIQIFNGQGQKVYEILSEGKKTNVDLSFLKSGVYQYIIQGEKTKAVGRIVIL